MAPAGTQGAGWGGPCGSRRAPPGKPLEGGTYPLPCLLSSCGCCWWGSWRRCSTRPPGWCRCRPPSTPTCAVCSCGAGKGSAPAHGAIGPEPTSPTAMPRLALASPWHRPGVVLVAPTRWRRCWAASSSCRCWRGSGRRPGGPAAPPGRSLAPCPSPPALRGERRVRGGWQCPPAGREGSPSLPRGSCGDAAAPRQLGGGTVGTHFGTPG